MAKSIAQIRRGLTIRPARRRNQAVFDASRVLSHPSVSMATRAVEVVYYVRLDEKTVKIGYSQNLLQRLGQMCRTPSDVIAIEFGGRELEQQRHRQFRHLRKGRSERFRTGADLIDHMRQLRQKTAA